VTGVAVGRVVGVAVAVVVARGVGVEAPPHGPCAP
jgi:hypothetical protein